MHTKSDRFHIHDPLIGIAGVMRSTSLSRTSIYRLMASGNFPGSVPLTPGGSRIAWRESEVQKWVEAPLEWGLGRSF